MNKKLREREGGSEEKEEESTTKTREKEFDEIEDKNLIKYGYKGCDPSVPYLQPSDTLQNDGKRNSLKAYKQEPKYSPSQFFCYKLLNISKKES